MKKFIKATQITTVLFAVVLFTFGAAQPANASLLDGLDLNLGSALDSLQNTSGSQAVTNTSNALTYSTCKLSVDAKQISYGESVKLTWDTSGFSTIKINGQSVSGDSGSMTVTNITQNTIFELVAVDGNDECKTTVSVTCLPPPVLECKLEVLKTVDKTSAKPGDELTYTITVKNTGTGPCTGGGVKIVDELHSYIEYLSNTITSNLNAGYGSKPVYDAGTRTLYFNGNTLEPGESGTITWTGKVTAPATCGDYEVTNKAKATAKELNNFLTWVYSDTVETDIDNECQNPVPSCDTFTASPSSIVNGNSSVLSWTTSNATRVAINNGIGDVPLNGDVTVTPLVSTTYTLTVFGSQGQTDDVCTVPVTVTQTSVPVCKSFTASPSNFSFGGGTTTLAWEVENATSVSISPTVGSVGLIGSKDLFVATNTNYTLTATDADGDTVSCPATVTVQPKEPEVFTCGNNVTFTASDYSITRGQSTDLNWNVTGADSVSISQINATTASGNQSVTPSSDTTYTLTATKGSESIDCPITVTVSGGGGGGGSSSPRCELEISDTKISRGEEITLKWDTSRATEVTLTDDTGKVLFTTEDMLSSDKKDFYDHSITLTPTRNTEYTLLAERGTRDDECKVEVEIEGLTVLQTRDQQPLVAGISLSNVPYTGFEAGPVLTLMFYLLLMAWALYVTYFLVLRQRTAGNTNFTPDIIDNSHTESGVATMKAAETVRPDVFTATTVASTATAIPNNLPVAPVEKTVGYESYFAGNAVSEKTADEVVTQLENRAHAQRALLSSDAVEYFMKTTEGEVERNEALDSVISEAKKHYPLEDGWVVINQARMQSLCETCVVKQEDSLLAHLPEGTGSLAEAIVSGNIVAAYELIGNRPMFALADAAADFDAVYRNRQGATETVSEMLTSESKNLSDEKIKNVIKALTGALDGTYTDEASAVKMAIMKAVKEIA